MSVYLRTITLAASPFALVPGAKLRDPEGSSRFWHQVAEGLEASNKGRVHVVADHAGAKNEQGHYATLSEDSLEHPPQLFTITDDGDQPDLVLPEGCVLQSIEMRVHDHHTSIIELLIDVTEYLGRRRLSATDVVGLETLAHELGAQACAGFGQRWIGRLDQLLEASDADEEFVSSTDEPGLELLWTSRALFTDRDTEARLGLAEVWLRDANDDPRAVPELVAGQRDHVVSWLNYLFLDDAVEAAATLRPDRPARDVWAGLRYAQYFYASLEQVDNRLADVLAQTHATLRGAELAELREELTDAAHAADLIVMERQRTEKYLRRSVRRHMQAVLSGWDTDELVEQPVRHKAALCTQRVAAIEGDLARQAGVWTDLILLGIAVTSILGTALAVVSFGRAIGSDSGMAGYDSGSSGLIEWLASQPADNVLITSLVISAGLGFIYVLYRRSSQS